MKILVLKPDIVARSNGGEISMIERLRLFQSWGAEVQVDIVIGECEKNSVVQFLRLIGSPLFGERYSVDGLNCRIHFSPKVNSEPYRSQSEVLSRFLEILDRENPDLVWVHYTDYFAVVAAISWNPNKVWVNITDNEFPRQIELNLVPMIGQAYLKIKNIIVASEFMKKVVQISIPWATVRLLPSPIEMLNDSIRFRRPEAWVFVNPVQVKGVEFTNELARELSDQNFCYIGNWNLQKPQHLPSNVTYFPRQPDLRKIFSHAKGLLVPSVWDEAFGRVALEAMSAGVPVVASNRGALPTTVSEGGIFLPLETSLWLQSMKTVEKYFEDLETSGYHRAERYRQQRDQVYESLRLEFGINKSRNEVFDLCRHRNETESHTVAPEISLPFIKVFCIVVLVASLFDIREDANYKTGDQELILSRPYTQFDFIDDDDDF